MRQSGALMSRILIKVTKKVIETIQKKEGIARIYKTGTKKKKMFRGLIKI